MPQALALAPRAQSRNGMLAGASAVALARPRGEDEEDDANQYLPVETLRKQYLDYLSGKIDEIEEQKEARRYYNGAQWDAEAIRILRDRHQPPTTWNKTAPKINGIVGLVERMRSDPKALPNKPKSEAGAEIATQSIRSVLIANDWKTRDPECTRQCGINGLAGVGLKLVKRKTGDCDLKLEETQADEYFYDPKSIQYDFADKRYDGIGKWFDIEAAVDLFPDKEELLRDLVENGADLSINSDREYKWVSTASRRLRVIEHWYKHRGQWCWAFYVATSIIDEGVSPFCDENGDTISRFIMWSAAVDQDGDRYGFVRNLKGPQDALNQSKSKSLHLANTKLVKATKNAVDDVETARREVARPDGWLEINPGGDFEIVDTKGELAVFMKFAEDAASTIDQSGNTNVANLNGTALTNISGRAIELLRQPGMAELGPFILSHRGWKLRVARAVWSTIQRFWTAERFIRVNGEDNEVIQFIQLNGLDLDQFGRPVIINSVAALDVDIDLEEGRDVATAMDDVYDELKGYPPGTFPPQVLIEFAPIPRSKKKKMLEMMSPQQPAPDPMAELLKKLSLEQLAAQNADLQADATKKQAEAAKTHAQVEQVAADAELKRSGVVKNQAGAAKLAFDAHLGAGDFALRAASEAREALTSEPATEGERPEPRPTPVVVPHPMPSAYPPPF